MSELTSGQAGPGQAQPADQGIAAAINRALDALAKGEVAQARTLLEEAITLDPSHPAPRHNQAELEFRTGQIDRAQALFEQLVNGWPSFLPAYPSFLALLEQRQASGVAASAELRPVLLNNFGNALLAAGQIGAAEGAYRQALGLRPDYANALANLSNALRLLGRLSEAELAARGALALQAGHAGAWVNLGCALEELAFHAEAEACHRRALELQGDQPEALHNLGSGQLMRDLYRSDLSEAELLERHRAWGRP
ncbi:tetratricopeptide repeat protein [Cyanobium sp. ATX-6F1]|uniref:tetratricopeptide repeat protein n=1 Tax=Cyanobium sp. ATX-6F1 TaxID=3137388 RepID=UPI0039BEBCE2